MVKHTQTICRLLPTNCLSMLDHFVGFALIGVKSEESMDRKLCVEETIKTQKG